MNLEKQVCSLDLAKKLKELGVKQDSYFVWVSYKDPAKFDKGSLVMEAHDAYENTYNIIVSAFTVAELGEMLPHQIIREGELCELIQLKTPSGQYGLRLQQYVPQFGNAFYKTPLDFAFFLKDTEADARAKMLVYLLENKLITL